MHTSWHIVGGRIVDPSTGTNKVADLHIHRGRIVRSVPRSAGVPLRIDARGLTVVPGLIDLHVHFREPGNEQAETIESGSQAAARGGFTTVVTMPNTRPAVDTPRRVAWQIAKGESVGGLRLRPAGCITKGRQGKALADLAGMKQAGAVAFTDDGATVGDGDLMARAMTLAASLDMPIMDHALDPVLTGSGVMHRGAISSQLKLPGIPSQAEIEIVRRDIALAERTGCAVHIQHISARQSIDLIRAAQSRGLRVSGEATPHHLALCDTDVRRADANFKMSPPLRSKEDRVALLAAVADGTVQVLATDHAPHTPADKARGFLNAPFGVVGSETAVGVTFTMLVQPGIMSVMDWVHRWTLGPAGVLGLDVPSLEPGCPADLAILDLQSEWTVAASQLSSKSRNTPFEGRRLVGRAVCTMKQGRLTWDGRSPANDARSRFPFLHRSNVS